MDFKRVRVSRKALLEIFQERVENILKKNADYSDAWQTNGPFTPLVRVKEKIIRVETLSDGRVAMVVEENVETTIGDIFDYTLLWLLWHKKQQKTQEYEQLSFPDISKFQDHFSKRVMGEWVPPDDESPKSE